MGYAVLAAVFFLASATAPSPPEPLADEFKTVISPLLMSRCSPCHAPGGKMYARIPFDQPEAVRSHEAGVLRRLKGEDEETVKAWLDEGSRESKVESRR
jgi:hypothetical protein